MKNTHILPTENYKQDYTTMRGEVLEVVRLGQLIVNKETGELLVNKNPQWAASCDTDILVPHHIYITSDEEIKDEDWVIETLNKVIFKLRNNTNDYSNSTFLKIILTTDQDLIADGVQPVDDEFLKWFCKNPSCEKVRVVKENICARCYSNDTDECWSAKECSDGRYDKIIYKIIIPQEEPKQENCCTPVGHIKRYVDCIGCDRKPKQEVLQCGDCNSLVSGEGICLCHFIEPKQETLEEAAEIFYSEQSKAFEDAIESMFDNSRYLVAGFIDGAKWQAERMYSEEELRNAMNWMLTQYFEFHEQPTTGRIDHYIQSLKQ